MELKDCIHIIKKRIWLIIATTILVSAATALFSIFIMNRVYVAKATLIIGHAPQIQDEKVGYDDILMYQKLLKTYMELAKSRLVGKEALDISGYGINYEAFKKNLIVTPMNDTQILEISLSDGDPNRAADLANTISHVFVEKVHELMDAGSVKIMDEALPPVEPERPKPILYTIIAGLIGLIFSTGLAFMMEYMDNTIKCEDDITRYLSLPILASLPLVPGRKHKSNQIKLVTMNEPMSLASESYKTMRTNIKFMSFQKDIKTILVTSPGPGDGKSTITANLAITMASAKLKVLLIECDLRKPSVHRNFAVPNNTGLTNILADNIPYKNAVIPSSIENLEIIPCGIKPPNPSEMLGSDRMKKFLDAIRDDYDCILLDTPPVAVVTDAALLSSICDGTILTLSYGHTNKESAIKAKELLNNADIRILGAVLNKVKVDKSKWHYKYYQSYYGKSKKKCIFQGNAFTEKQYDHV